MSMIEIHQEAIQAGSALFHEFIARYKKTKKCVYGFVEGNEDPSFYRGFIEYALPQEWSIELWRAGNKDKVVKLHSELDWGRFPKNRVAFFVDKDLSVFFGEILPNEINIYVTDQYSIENDVVTGSTFDRVITEVCNLSVIGMDDKDLLFDLFESQKERFIRCLVPIMSWIIYWKRSGEKPCLSDICMKHLFSFIDGQLMVNPNPKGKASYVEYIHSQCNIQYDPSVDISGIEQEFGQNDNMKRFTRGKYLFWFLVNFAISVHRDISRLVTSINESPKMVASLGNSNGMVLIAPRARIPESLKTFIDNTFGAYIGEVRNAG